MKGHEQKQFKHILELFEMHSGISMIVSTKYLSKV